MKAKLIIIFLLMNVPALNASEPSVNTIDYANPSRYLQIAPSLGSLDAISSQALKLKSLSNIDTIRNIVKWMHQNLQCDETKAYAWRNFDDVMREKTYGACADEAITCGVLLKAAGIPAVWVKTMDVSWIWDFKKGRPFSSWSGHVFLEVYMNGKWALLDPGGEMIYFDYSTEMRILPGYRYAYHKGNDPKQMVMSLQWDEWKEQTEKYFKNFDESLLPVDVPRGRKLTRYFHIVCGKNREQMEKLVQDSGFSLGMLIGQRFEKWLPQTKDDVLLVETHNGKPVVALDLLEKYFPDASLGLKQPDGIIQVGGTIIVFIDFDKTKSIPNLKELDTSIFEK